MNLVQVFQRIQLGHVAQFAHAAHDELGVLGAEVNDGYEVLVVHVKEELTGIIDGFFRDGDIVGMAFFQAAGGDLHEPALFRSSSRLCAPR